MFLTEHNIENYVLFIIPSKTLANCIALFSDILIFISLMLAQLVDPLLQKIHYCCHQLLRCYISSSHSSLPHATSLGKVVQKCGRRTKRKLLRAGSLLQRVAPMQWLSGENVLSSSWPMAPFLIPPATHKHNLKTQEHKHRQGIAAVICTTYCYTCC